MPYIFVIIIGCILLGSIKQVDQYERGILFTFGKYTKILQPGWRLVFPIIQSFKKVDIRTKAVDVQEQETITKDNVSIKLMQLSITKSLMLEKQSVKLMIITMQ